MSDNFPPNEPTRSGMANGRYAAFCMVPATKAKRPVSVQLADPRATHRGDGVAPIAAIRQTPVNRLLTTCLAMRNPFR